MLPIREKLPERISQELPKWVVSVNGTEIPELEYSTAEGINQQKSAIVTGLNVAVEEYIIIQWFTTIAGTSGARRQLALTM